MSLLPPADLPAKYLTVDPGEDTGFGVWAGHKLIEASTEKLWYFIDCVYNAVLKRPLDEFADARERALVDLLTGIELIICEDFRIYPWVAKSGGLDWDQVRTARGIGALTLITRVANIPFVIQGAKIKPTAMAAGAGDLFMSPRHENRHANDAIMHGVYYQAVRTGVAPPPDEIPERSPDS